MNLVSLTEYLVKSLVQNSEDVSIKSFEQEEDTIIEVLVSNHDIGLVIGKDGVTANAIRTIVQAAAYANQLKKVKINFNSY